MATRCEVCGKRPRSGNAVSHSMRHTKRKWRPNIQKATLYFSGVPKQLSLCTRCLRTHYKHNAA